VKVSDRSISSSALRSANVRGALTRSCGEQRPIRKNAAVNVEIYKNGKNANCGHGPAAVGTPLTTVTQGSPCSRYGSHDRR
jgi:hypothetical protein